MLIFCHTKINEDEDEPEEDWKVEAEESDSDIDAGDRVMVTLSAELGQDGFNGDFKVFM